MHEAYAVSQMTSAGTTQSEAIELRDIGTVEQGHSADILDIKHNPEAPMSGASK